MFWDTFLMAISAIARNKVRSLLTSLGIIIGVGSVIAMIHLGQAASQSVTDSISSLGSNLLMINTERSKRGLDGRRQWPESFVMEDIRAIRTGIDGVTVAGTNAVSTNLSYGTASRAGQVTGSNQDYLDVRGWTLAAGRNFNDAEEMSGDLVCVLGDTVVRDLYADREPIGSTLKMGRSSCQVIGVLQAKGDSFGNDQDDIVIMPFKAVQRRFTGRDDVAMIMLTVDDEKQTDQIKRSLELLLRTRRDLDPREENDFVINDMKEVARALEQVTFALTALLGAIAAISLLVGGIGIMNIMLVSVTERTREIGVRLAIGATAKDVQWQFLVEASMLSALGGVIGIVLGVGGTMLATHFMELPFVLSPQAILISFGFSAMIGVVFGFVPARKAAKLNPIEALRHE